LTVASDGLQYDRMMEEALRGVMRRALGEVAQRGLPGQHHFYITFRTDHQGVDIPPVLRQRYPREMTIVLQYQFWGLDIDDDHFEVTLSFDSKHERLSIPYAAITAFVDPSVQFGLQFQPGEPAADTATPPPAIASAAKPASVPGDPPPTAPIGGAGGDGRVIKLDTFRKK
jgi:hypothetical protein